MDNLPSTEEAICSREDFSADLSAREAVLCACRHESALGLGMCVISVDPRGPFSVINVHVLENIGPFGGCTGGVWLFELGLFYAEISLVEDREPCQNVQCRHLSVFKTPLSNWRAVCQLKRFICWIRGPLQKLHPLSDYEDTVPSWQKSGHSFDWKRRCNISIVVSRYRYRSFSPLVAQSVRGQRTELLGSRLKHTPERESSAPPRT